MNASSSHLGPLALSAALLVIGLVPSGLAARLRDVGKNVADLDRMEHAYYERLLATDPLGDEPPRAAPPFKDGPLALAVADYRECVLKPGLAVEAPYGRWTTNELGLRDRPYAAAKPPGTFRIVLVGDSIGVAWGVDDGLGFEPRLEAALDARSHARGGPAVEILNLCVPGYAPGQRAEHLRRLGASLQPDLIVYQATTADLAWDERRLRMLLPRGIGDDLPMFGPVLARVGWSARLSGAEAIAALARLRPLRPALVEGAYREVAARGAELECPVAWVLVPRVGRQADRDERRLLRGLAERAGFAIVLDLSDAFDGLAAEDLAIADDDYHPNVTGHALLAGRLESALIGSPGRWPWSGTGRHLAAADLRGPRQ